MELSILMVLFFKKAVEVDLIYKDYQYEIYDAMEQPQEQ